MGGVIRFLSPEWLAALDAAVAGNDQLCRSVADVDLIVRQVVLGGPEGDVAYSLRLAHGTAGVSTDGADADIEVVQDYATAAAISRGELTSAAAFAAGRIKLGGSVGQLIRHGGMAGGLGDLFSTLRASTTY